MRQLGARGQVKVKVTGIILFVYKNYIDTSIFCIKPTNF